MDNMTDDTEEPMMSDEEAAYKEDEDTIRKFLNEIRNRKDMPRDFKEKAMKALDALDRICADDKEDDAAEMEAGDE